jgi:hypothetical protein
MNRNILNLVSIVTVVSLAMSCCLCSDFSPIETGYESPEATDLPPTPTLEPFEPLGIVSEKELTPEEFLLAVEEDESFWDVFTLANEQGYTEPFGGGEFVASDGMVLRGLLLGSVAEEKLVTAIQFQGDDRTYSLLARVEAESKMVVLYDRNGRAEISEQGIKVFDAAGNPVGETASSDGHRPPGLAAQSECDDPRPYTFTWEDFDHCGRSYSGAAWGQILGCISGYIGAVLGVTFASAAAAPFVYVGGLAAVFVACRVPAKCVVLACRDDPPTTEVRIPQKLAESCRVECGVAAGEDAMLTIHKYRFQVYVDDDRKRKPNSPQSFDVCAGELKVVPIRDCAGHQVEVRLEAPDPSLEDFSPCAAGKVCIREGDSARCVAGVQLPESGVYRGEDDIPLGQNCSAHHSITIDFSKRSFSYQADGTCYIPNIIGSTSTTSSSSVQNGQVREDGWLIGTVNWYTRKDEDNGFGKITTTESSGTAVFVGYLMNNFQSVWTCSFDPTDPAFEGQDAQSIIASAENCIAEYGHPCCPSGGTWLFDLH